MLILKGRNYLDRGRIRPRVKDWDEDVQSEEDKFPFRKSDKMKYNELDYTGLSSFVLSKAKEGWTWSKVRQELLHRHRKESQWRLREWIHWIDCSLGTGKQFLISHQGTIVYILDDQLIIEEKETCKRVKNTPYKINSEEIAIQYDGIWYAVKIKKIVLNQKLRKKFSLPTYTWVDYLVWIKPFDVLLKKYVDKYESVQLRSDLYGDSSAYCYAKRSMNGKEIKKMMEDTMMSS